MSKTSNGKEKRQLRVVGTQGEIICCDVCGERIGKNLTGYAWRTHRAICGLCLDDAVNAIGKYFPKLERPNDKVSDASDAFAAPLG